MGEPSDKIAAPSVFKYDASAAAALTGIYFDLQQNGGPAQGVRSIGLCTGLSSDEFDIYARADGAYQLIYTNNVVYSGNTDFWTSLYNFVYRANTSLEGLAASTTLSSAVKKQLNGEAKFMRAFCYFYLTNLYGDVPLITTSDYSTNQSVGKTSADKVYEQIVNDLLDAQNSLSETFMDNDVVSPTSERLRPTKWAATALLARVYLYTQKWKDAEIQATAVIDNRALFDTVPLNDVFLKNSKEAIWQLQPNSIDGSFQHTLDGQLYVLIDSLDYSHFVSASDSLVQSFENGDLRKTSWLNTDSVSTGIYHYIYKYKMYDPRVAPTEYCMVMRLAEQYLIRAEARAEQDNLANARSDLNVIRSRAGLPGIIATSKEDFLIKLMHERRTELFTEWGNRWFDLKRTGMLNQAMQAISSYKKSNWQPYMQFYPIPVRDIQLDPHLAQNMGYPSI